MREKDQKPIGFPLALGNLSFALISLAVWASEVLQRKECKPQTPKI
jgi:hypothetical protein